jgi:hypothetical protein
LATLQFSSRVFFKFLPPALQSLGQKPGDFFGHTA